MATVEEAKRSTTSRSTSDSDENNSVDQRNSENKLVNLDKSYLKTVEGVLRLLTSIFSLVAFICEEQIPDCWRTDTTCLMSVFKHYSTYRYFGIITLLIFLSSLSLFFFRFTRFSFLKKVTPLFGLVTHGIYLGVTSVLLFFADLFLFIQMSGFVAHRYAAIFGLFTLGSLILQLVHEIMKLSAIKQAAHDSDHVESSEHEEYDRMNEAWALDQQSETQSINVPKLSFIRPRSSSVDLQTDQDAIPNEQMMQINLNTHQNTDYEDVFISKETNADNSSEASSSGSSQEENVWVVTRES
ncbi:uncharacterized protein LOC106471581 [Limulus polyphemus]|uniref:Uncharacterized protein LOC106471581 n=1 Tax=Limulus polyphemus TaxID=6850 RepID=A0ABM1BS72_LIMPO|nr:uncharacterized protein LOC106471581 [Limulus polyphemus]